jgi:tol-pal system protein YbgF
MDSVSSDLRTVQQAVADLTSLIDKMQTQLTDANNALKVLQAPPAAPPGPAGGAAAPGPPPLSAEDMLANADADRGANHLDIALQGYSDFLKYYPNTAQAADAQFYIGYIYYQRKDYESAVAAFQAVADKYPNSSKRVPQALYYQGKSLLGLGQRTAAAELFRDVYKEYPTNSNAKLSCDELQKLNYRCETSAPLKSPGRKKQ